MRCSWCADMPFLPAPMRCIASKPLVQRNFAALHDGADRHGELLTAFIALVQAGTMRLAFKLAVILS